MDYNEFVNAKNVGEERTVKPAPPIEKKEFKDTEQGLIQDQENGSRNSWIMGFVISVAVLIVPMLSLLIIKDKQLFCSEFMNLITGRDIMILSISTILSLVNIKEWNVSSKTRIILLCTEIVMALIYGSFSIAGYISGTKDNVVTIFVNLLVVLSTGYCIVLGYRKR